MLVSLILAHFAYFIMFVMLYNVNADPTKIMEKRYVPPGARSRGAANSKNHVEDSPRKLDDIVRDQGGDVFTVKLRSNNTYGKI